MKKTLSSIFLGLVLAVAVSPIVVFAGGCYGMLMAVDPETGEQVNCYLVSDGQPCRYRCPFGDIEN